MRRALFPLGLLALAALLGFTVVQLFRLRFERGDVYPAASTLRADPLGAKALHDALKGIPGYEVRRNFRPLTTQRPGAPLTLVYAGIARKSLWGEEELQHFETLITHGSRAVFAFAPEMFDRGAAPAPTALRARTKQPAAPQAKESGTAPLPPTADEPSEDSVVLETAGVSFGDALRKWGGAFALPSTRSASNRRAIAAPEAPDVEPEISWHSGLYFKDLSATWRTLYTCEGRPVVIERPLGDGTIVLASDSYFLSNEALLRERHPRLLAWLLGPARTVIFDEEHHGVREQANLASLVGKYRLHGVIAGLALIAALILWKLGIPLVPKESRENPAAVEVHGKDAEAGFINLLRRSVPPARLVQICVEEWEKNAGRQATDAERAHARSVLAAHGTHGGKNAVAAYRAIAEGLAARGSIRASTPTRSL